MGASNGGVDVDADEGDDVSKSTEKAIRSLNYYAGMPPSRERAAGLLSSALWYAATVLKREGQQHDHSVKHLALKVETMVEALKRSKANTQ